VSLSAVAAVEGPRGTQTVERHDGTTAQVRGVGEVLASWTGTIPVEAGARIVADRGGHARVWREPKRGGQVLGSWSGWSSSRLAAEPRHEPRRLAHSFYAPPPRGPGRPGLQARAADSAARQPAQASQIEVMRRRVAATNSKDFAAWETLHAPGACRSTPDLQGSICGRAAMRAALETLSAAFADYALELVEASGECDRLAVRMHASGTHTGTLILSDGTAVPPTGRHFQQDWVALVTFDPQGRIEHIDEFYDEFVLLLQLGLAQPL
jgi:ketosteroid isomerase-like protein